MDLLPLISIPVIYFSVALLKPYFKGLVTFNICAVCVAVSLTWVGLAVMWLLGLKVALLEVAILMGMSITGIMYKLESIFKINGLRNYWFVRLVIVICGFYSVNLFLSEEWDLLLIVVVGSLLAILIPTFFFQGTTHSDVMSEQKKLGRKSSLIKKLDDCC